MFHRTRPSGGEPFLKSQRTSALNSHLASRPSASILQRMDAQRCDMTSGVTRLGSRTKRREIHARFCGPPPLEENSTEMEMPLLITHSALSLQCRVGWRLAAASALWVVPAASELGVDRKITPHSRTVRGGVARGMQNWLDPSAPFQLWQNLSQICLSTNRNNVFT